MWGNKPYRDRNGDYKQPTIIDLDKEYGKKKVYELPFEVSVNKQEVDDYKKEQVEFILSANPFYLAQEFSHLILRISGKLEWDKEKVMEVCKDDTVRYNIYTLLSKRIETHVPN